MGGQVAEREPKGGKKGLRRPKRRISILIDMTPMVDIAFLLLIFYMVTTVFAMPQAMEINLPKLDDMNDTLIVKETNLLTLRVDEQGSYWWNLKRANPDNLPQLIPTAPDTPDTVFYKFNGDSLQGLLIAHNRENDKLSTLVLIHREATYSDMVNILDEIDLIERSWNAYTAEQLDVKVGDIPRDKKFSYRYAIGEWVERDDKVIAAARAAIGVVIQEGE